MTPVCSSVTNAFVSSPLCACRLQRVPRILDRLQGSEEGDLKAGGHRSFIAVGRYARADATTIVDRQNIRMRTVRTRRVHPGGGAASWNEYTREQFVRSDDGSIRDDICEETSINCFD